MGESRFKVFKTTGHCSVLSSQTNSIGQAEATAQTPTAAQILELTGVRRVLQSQAMPEMEVCSGLLPNGSIYNPHRGLRLFELAKEITPGAGGGGMEVKAADR